jgi:hypothetical protein
MVMVRKLVVLSVALGLALAALASADEGKVSKKEIPVREPVYKTPQAVYDAAQKAAKTLDGKKLWSCMSKGEQDHQVGSLVVMPHLLKAFGSFGSKEPKILEQVEKNLKPLFDVLKKHKLTEEDLKERFKDKGPKDSPGKGKMTRENLQKIASAVKNRKAFFVDMLAALKKQGKKEEKPGKAELKDLEIDGDKATGVDVMTKDGKETRRPIKFVKEGGSWKIDEMALSGGPPTGPATKPAVEKRP